MYFIHFTFYRLFNSIVYRFFKFIIYAFQPFGCKVNSINKTIYLYLSSKRLKFLLEIPHSYSHLFLKNVRKAQFMGNHIS